MPYDYLQEKLELTRRRLAVLADQAGKLTERAPVIQEVLEELASSLEEIHVLSEELRQQNDELVATRQTVEAERQRYQELFELAPDGYLVTDPEGIIHEANRAAAVMLGVSQDFLLSKPLLVFVPEKDRPAFHGQLSRIQREAAALFQWNIELQPRGAAAFPSAVTVSCVQSAGGRLVGLRWLVRDVTETRRTEEALRQARSDLELRVLEAEHNAKSLAAMNRASRAMVSSLNVHEVLQTIIREVRTLLNTEGAAVLRYEPKEEALVFIAAQGIGAERLIGQRIPVQAGIHGWVFREQRPTRVDDIQGDPRYYPHLEGLADIPLRSLLAVPLIAHGQAGGVLVTANKSGGSFSEDDERVLMALANAVAISIANAELFSEVQANQERLRQLSRRLVEAQEVERRALAREIHDEIGQALTGLRLLLERKALATGQVEQPDDALELVRALQSQVHDLSLDLRPSMLDDQGLLPALIWNIERFQRRTEIRVSFKHMGLEAQRFLPEVETVAYRVVQEALTNVARHAHVREAVVRVWVSENTLWTQIEDAGVGFDPVTALASHATIGLAGMQERVAMVGGSLSIVSAPGSGSTLLAEFPLA